MVVSYIDGSYNFTWGGLLPVLVILLTAVFDICQRHIDHGVKVSTSHQHRLTMSTFFFGNVGVPFCFRKGSDCRKGAAVIVRAAETSFEGRI